MSLPQRNGRVLVLALLLPAVALAAGLLFLRAFPLPPVENDGREYLALARSVAAGTGFSLDGRTPAVYRPPLFSLLLGGWFLVTGTSSHASAAVFQCILHALGVLAAFLLFRELTPRLRWAAGGALFLALSPLLVTRTALVLQEPALLLFTTAACLASARLVRAPAPGRAALAGAAWGVCALGKVVAGFAPFLLLGMRWLPGRLRWSWRGKEAALLLLFFALAIAPWTARNYDRFHRFVAVNAEGEGMLLWVVSDARIPGEAPGTAYAEHLSGGRLDGRERRALLWRYILDHPRYFLLDRAARNLVHFAAPARDWWIARGAARPGEHGARYWLLAALFHAPLYGGLLVRAWQWGRGVLPPPWGFLVLFYGVYWAVHAIVWGDPRFGVAVYPVLVAMALPRAAAPTADAAPRCGAIPRTP